MHIQNDDNGNGVTTAAALLTDSGLLAFLQGQSTDPLDCLPLAAMPAEICQALFAPANGRYPCCEVAPKQKSEMVNEKNGTTSPCIDYEINAD